MVPTKQEAVWPNWVIFQLSCVIFFTKEAQIFGHFLDYLKKKSFSKKYWKIVLLFIPRSIRMLNECDLAQWLKIWTQTSVAIASWQHDHLTAKL